MIDWQRLYRRLLLFPAVLVVGIVRWIAPLFLVRFGIVHSSRIGHFASNVEIYLGERELGLHPKGRFGGVDIWFYDQQVCNRQLSKMVRRKLLVGPSVFTRCVYIVNLTFQGAAKHICASANMDRDIHDTLHKTPQHIQFTDAELRRGMKTMRDWGVMPGDKWVCLVARDSTYLPELKYHNYRDVSIKTYRKTAMMLSVHGYHVFRMGAKVAEPLGVPHPLIHDYAANGTRSDFMDIYLGAHCAFCVSTPCGIDAIPMIFRRPMCFINMVPVEYLSTWKRGIAIWKHHYKDGKHMSLKEIFESGAGKFQRAEEFIGAGIKLVDNSSEEIYDAVSEMVNSDRNCRYIDSQDAFWSVFPFVGTDSDTSRLHGTRRLRIGHTFLESYR